MPYYEDKKGALHFLDDAGFEHLLPDGCQRITDELAHQKIKEAEESRPRAYPRYYGNDKLDKPFTKEEQLAVVEASMTDPAVKLMYDRLLNAEYLTYEDPETEQSLALLVAKGLLTPGRKAEIVASMQPV